MTEAEWLAWGDPTRMVEFIGDGESRWSYILTLRKCQLFAVACCRHVEFPVRIGSIDGLAVAEAVADRIATEDEANLLRSRIRQISRPYRPSMLRVVQTTLEEFNSPFAIARSSTACIEQYDDGCLPAVASSLRCIFGNPFRPVAADPSWLTSTVVQLAQGIYEERAFDRMPILADALQDAGCENDDVLNHCRDSNGTHARGCWVIDLILGKS